jgi:hypothetical protein
VVVAANLWADLGAPLILAVAGAAIAAIWPSWQGFRRRERLTALMKRELQEIGPKPPKPSPEKQWWQQLPKRFVHEEFFRKENIVENRDFLLSLHPTLVFHASQLWIAFDKHDLEQWLVHLEGLLSDEDISEQVATEQARDALDCWKRFVPTARRVQPGGRPKLKLDLRILKRVEPGA